MNYRSKQVKNTYKVSIFLSNQIKLSQESKQYRTSIPITVSTVVNNIKNPVIHNNNIKKKYD